jgi:glycyl-tRNA synthetase alpha subunit
MVSKKKKNLNKNSFQETIFNLQKFWSNQGCIILQPYDLEVGAGTFHPATTLRSLGSKPMESSLCSAIQKTNRWKIWRKSKSITTLLSVSSDYKTLDR